jgi:hypothetical protein
MAADRPWKHGWPKGRVAVFTLVEGGAMAEASVWGRKLGFNSMNGKWQERDRPWRAARRTS